MAEKQDPLRIAAAVLLGVITGAILFLVVALGIGIINNLVHMNIPISMDIAENVVSASLLVFLIGICITAFYWKVETTPPTEPEAEEETEPEIS